MTDSVPELTLGKPSAETALETDWWRQWGAGQALQERARNVFSVPSAILLLVRWCAVGSLCSFALTWWLFSPLSFLPQAFAMLYGAVVGLGLGATWGSVRVVERTLDSVWQLIDLVFEGMESAIKDFKALRRGQVSAASLRTLSQTLYSGLLYPVVQRATRQATGFFARPIVWALDKTIMRLITRAIAGKPAQLPDDAVSPPDSEDLSPVPPPETSLATSTLSSARTRIHRLRANTRAAALLPLIAIASVNSLIITLPLLILHRLLV